MDCSEFIARFSDYYDRSGTVDETGAMEAHLESCGSCRRYHRVVTRGGQLLRSLPRPTVRPDFRPRLQHRIYHLEDEAVLSPASGSGTTAVTAVAMAVLLTLAAWTPAVTLDRGEVGPLPDIADTFRRPLPERAAEPASLFPPASVATPRPFRERGLWSATHSHSLLYEYSLLSTERSRERAQLRQMGLE